MTERKYTMAVLGRTPEHLGVQMYKQRPAALAELVANAWDADATRVWIEVPKAPWQQRPRSLSPTTGQEWTPDEVADFYLVIGRNRREIETTGPTDEDPASGHLTPSPVTQDVETLQPLTNPAVLTSAKRKVMGRKGIGKLAGFESRRWSY